MLKAVLCDLNRRAFVAGTARAAAAAFALPADSSQGTLTPKGGRPLDVAPSPAWTAHWIAPKGVNDTPNVFFRARKRFELDPGPGQSVPDSILLHIAAESTYRLYVNGQLAGQGPARGTRTLNFFDSYEVAPLLRRGENWIAVLVACMNIPTFKHAPARPALLLQMSDRSLATDASWQVSVASDWRRDVPLFTFQTGFMEWHDLREEPAGWQTGKDSAKWDVPEVVAPANGLASKRLLARDIPPLVATSHFPCGVPVVASLPPVPSPGDTAIARLLSDEPHEPLSCPANPLLVPDSKPVLLSPQPGGRGATLILDFGQDFIGGFELDITAPSGTIVDIGYEEQLRGDRLKLVIGSYRFADRFILGAGRQVVHNIHERGFRFLQLAFRSFQEPVEIHAVRAIDHRYPVVSRATFHCSDALLNSIFSACALTLSTCATDTFIDCPWRELAFWVNDLLVENVIFLQAFGDPRLSAHSLRLALSQRRADGLILGVCPAKDEDRWVLVATNLFVPLMLEEYLLYSGDRELVEETLPHVLKILQTFGQWQDSEDLVTPPKAYWNFVDWSYGGQTLNGRPTAVLSFFHVMALDSTARLLRRLNRNDEAEALTAQAARIAKAADRHFWSDDKNCYAEWTASDGPTRLHTQLSHALAVLSGRVPDSRRQAVADALNRDDLLKPDLYLHHFILRALTRVGQVSAALGRVRRYWGPIVLSPSPTIWEIGVSGKLGKDYAGGAGSLCHGFATTPISFLQTTILGIQPLDPGFARFSLNPRPCDLSFASGSVPTPQGNIEIAWKRANTELSVELRVPPATKAELGDGRTFGPGLHRFTLPGEGRSR